MDQRFISECSIVTDNSASIPESKARSRNLVRSSASFGSSSSSSSFSRWDSQPKQPHQNASHHVTVLPDEKDEDSPTYDPMERFSLSDSCLEIRPRSSKRVAIAPPRLPQRTTSGSSVEFDDLSSEEREESNAVPPLTRALDDSHIALNSAPIANHLLQSGLGGSLSSQSMAPSIHEEDDHRLTSGKLTTHRFQQQSMLEQALFAAPASDPTPMAPSSKSSRWSSPQKTLSQIPPHLPKHEHFPSKSDDTTNSDLVESEPIVTVIPDQGGLQGFCASAAAAEGLAIL